MIGKSHIVFFSRSSHVTRKPGLDVAMIFVVFFSRHTSVQLFSLCFLYKKIYPHNLVEDKPL